LVQRPTSDGGAPAVPTGRESGDRDAIGIAELGALAEHAARHQRSEDRLGRESAQGVEIGCAGLGQGVDVAARAGAREDCFAGFGLGKDWSARGKGKPEDYQRRRKGSRRLGNSRQLRRMRGDVSGVLHRRC
jgi:hypothetical protein